MPNPCTLQCVSSACSGFLIGLLVLAVVDAWRGR